MEKIWELFENMNEMVYVADIDTYELVYMNKKMRETYGLSQEELIGKKCYEALQNCSVPCSICNNNELKTGYFKEWQYYNPIHDKHFMLKDTMLEEGKRRYRMELALDVSTQERQGSVLRGYQNVEAFVNEGLRIALQASHPDKSIAIVLEHLGKALNGERTFIFERNQQGGDDNTYEWAANGVLTKKDNFQNMPPEASKSWYQEFNKNKYVAIKSIEDIREKEPLQYQILKSENIHSLVVVPLFDEKEAIGFYGIDNPPVKSIDYVSNMLQLMAYFIVSALRRRNLVRQLQDISYRDQLTELGNRHAMSIFVQNMCQSKSIGVVYCDVTGLKRVNDTKGHAAGDKLIIRASESLKRVLGNYALFRIGGDEMLALCVGIEQEALEEKVIQLKKDMAENDVIMAVGAVWQEDNEVSIDKLLTESEQRMYEDKAAYYKASGIDRRK